MPAGRTSILVTRMLAQMCRNTWKSKEMPIHNGTHKGGAAAEGGRPTFVGAAEGRPHYGWAFLYFSKCFCTFGPAS